MLVKLKDYERIHRIISSVVSHHGNDPAHSCMWFSFFGAHILRSHYKVAATVRCGLAAFYVCDKNEILFFGEMTDDGGTGALDKFHCWIEADGWVIDFMAPAFPNLMGPSLQINPKMFQQRQSDMVVNFKDLRHPGDYFLAPTDHLTEARLKHLVEEPIYDDLVEICTQWFAKSPRKMRSKIEMTINSGKKVALNLSGPSVRGRW
ncbi:MULTISPECIES: DUF2026 family protein [Rhodobacterales]|uniref:DUF2026 family protein n=1 Tax=Rhodobacterales TaxID=204455 RepID=UPI0015F1135C|nr:MULTISPECIES: DUF2026 family protein [Rhodobacterales]MDO6590175.1 DUF2026 family protein [Yoonia sp. 1_MG-2023]